MVGFGLGNDVMIVQFKQRLAVVNCRWVCLQGRAKGDWQADRRSKVSKIFPAGYFRHAHSTRMGSPLLHVQQLVASRPKMVDQMDQSDLGSIPYTIKFALSGKETTNCNPIGSSNQLISKPCFHAVGMAKSMHFAIGVDHAW